MIVCLRTLACLAVLALAGQAATLVFVGQLTGPNENPPVPSPGTGNATVTYDSVAHTLLVEADWTGLIGTTTVAHIHCCIAPPGTIGVATYPSTFPGFPVGLSSGTYISPTLIDLTATSSYTTNFLNNFGGGTAAGAEAALINGLLAGEGYFNIHSTFAGGGEIRDFLQLIPEPGTNALVAGAFVALAAYRLRRRPRT
jgi:hypothetical protein